MLISLFSNTIISLLGILALLLDNYLIIIFYRCAVGNESTTQIGM